MQPVLRLLSIGLFTLVGIFLVVFGVYYASVDRMLFFHAAAVPEAARDAVTPLYLALMKLVGGASTALGLLCLFVTFGPLRRQFPLAGIALVATISLPVLTAAYVAERLAAQAGAPTSWHLMGIVLAIVGAAFVLHSLGARRVSR